MLLSEIEADCLISNIGSFLPLQTTCLPITRVTAQQPPYRASGLVHGSNLVIQKIARDDLTNWLIGSGEHCFVDDPKLTT